MHLLNAARKTMKCIPFVHEHSATVATEYFNTVQNQDENQRAFTLVTAGPGLTNAVTGIAGAYLESRECLIIGGQVKSEDLSPSHVRQRGIQEIDGVKLVESICKDVLQINTQVSLEVVTSLISLGSTGRKGPIFIEICLDVQGEPLGDVPTVNPSATRRAIRLDHASREASQVVLKALSEAERPVLMLGGGVNYERARAHLQNFESLGVPLMTTWNGFDRLPDNHPLFFGRPNNWGQRAANLLVAQADLIVALGTRLGVQQTGFNREKWTSARVLRVEVDECETWENDPANIDTLIADANVVLDLVAGHSFSFGKWIDYCRSVSALLPVKQRAQQVGEGFFDPNELIELLSVHLPADSTIVPASSGSGQFLPMQQFVMKLGQRVVTNKGLASMGYGLAGAIGASLARPLAPTVLIEGDGSFAQNLQEVGTVMANALNLKVFLIDNDGYASIRSTQKRHFGGEYIGCDSASGLELPDWRKLAEAYGVQCPELNLARPLEAQLLEVLEQPGPSITVVRIDPEFEFTPKVGSRVHPDGSIQSDPIFDMLPRLNTQQVELVTQFPLPTPLSVGVD